MKRPKLSHVIRSICVTSALITVFTASDIARAQEKPNVVLMMVDNLGWGEIGTYGGGILRGADTPAQDCLWPVACRRVLDDLAGADQRLGADQNKATGRHGDFGVYAARFGNLRISGRIQLAVNPQLTLKDKQMFGTFVDMRLDRSPR